MQLRFKDSIIERLDNYIVTKMVKDVEKYQDNNLVLCRYLQTIMLRLKMSRIMIQNIITFIDVFHHSLIEKDTAKRYLLCNVLSYMEDLSKKEFVEERKAIMELAIRDKTLANDF